MCGSGRCFIETNETSQAVPVSKQAAGRSLGRVGERLAAEELLRRGYHILERNFTCRYGEIDLVAEHEQDLVFVEVKTRRGNAYGLPEEAITRRKQQKLIQLAGIYLEQHACTADQSWRIDVVAVQMSRAGRLEEIRIYPHAVQSQEEEQNNYMRGR